MSLMWKQEEFEAYVHRIQETFQVPGVAVALAKDGQQIYQKGFGFRDKEKELPMTGDTVLGIASITKSFTCVGIMKLHEEGKLNIHDPVMNYLPEIREWKSEWIDEITLHHFMTHTSGLPPVPSLVFAMKRSMDQDPSTDDYPGLNMNRTEHGPIDTYEELMSFIAQLDVNWLGKPGTAFSYSNDAYALLGAIIERVSGESYEDYITTHILNLIGMNHSTFDLNVVDSFTDVTMLYAKKEREGEEEVYAAPAWWDAPAMRPAGFLRSTTNDMLKYTEIFRTGGKVGDQRILSEESVRLMTKPHVQYETGKYYGYGLMITPDYHGGTLIEHGGALKAISSQMGVIPEKGLSGIILTNLAEVPASQMLAGGLKALQNIDVEEPHIEYPDVQIPSEQLTPYVGEYVSNEGMSTEIQQEAGQLVMKRQNHSYPLRAIGDHQFFVQLPELEKALRFLVDDQGHVYGIAYALRQLMKTG